MSAAPRLGIPPLGGVCTLEQAARTGLSVEENVSRLMRYHWVERRLSDILIGRIPATPEWEVKGAFALHQWLDAEHAQALRGRITELRHPAPRLDASPAAQLEAFLRELECAGDTLRLLIGVYRVARPALMRAYREHLEATNPLVDHPTVRLLRLIITEEEDQVRWGERAIDALLDPASEAPAREWDAHLTAFLDAAGSIAGTHRPSGPAPPARAASNVLQDTTPRRDARFRGSYRFEFPPHVVCGLPHVPADERNLALLCKRLLEMDVPETMASFLTEDREMPWQHQFAYRRQLWDEARHSMMGEAAFEAAGIDWTRIPLNVGFPLRLNRYATPRERELLLYAIEQSLMPRDTGKRAEYETAVAAGDALSALFHDYDWADEVLHAQIGRAWLRRAGLHGTDLLERGRQVHEKTWPRLDEHRAQGDGPEWWFDFVREVLGKESAVRPEDLRDPDVVQSA